ncbi:serine hydrolase domain-containing protein [Flavicella sediminum]|uniref:serine hydrolase domain-containing protein n=1 Tax=Flavicella sediminum TaxID=2585141 RepID=UPI001FB7CF98|nr:serine hydrolase [Flavicella sediminum]
MKIVLLLVLLLVIVVGYLHYPKLNMISGYAAKNMATNVFYANRPIDSINTYDNGVPLIKLAKTKVDSKNKIVNSSVFGMLERKAFYREGLGAVLIDDDYNTEQKFIQPKRSKIDNKLPFPYGDILPKDSLFSTIDYDKLNTAISNAFLENHRPNLKNTRALLVVYKDQIIAEKYAEGFDENSKFLGWSMAKSLLAAVFGTLEKEKNFDIHQPVIATLKNTGWENDERAQITTHHLLKMVSGLDWEEDYTKISDVTKMLFLDRDMTKSQALKKASHKAGTNFIYSSGTTNLLSGVLRAQFKTYQEYLDFPYTSLIDKIGMNSMLFETDMEGNYVGSSYAWATARDWAKFGLLFLHEGNWNGEQIFNKTWAQYTATPTKESANEYGAQFWTNTDGFLPDAPRDMYYADGYHGQRVFIIPSKELVIVRTGLTHKGRTDSYDIMNKLVGDVVSAIKD